MGWKYEVSSWERFGDDSGYGYKPVYFGKSLVKAVLAMRKAKRESGCVKLLEWR